MIQLTVQYGQPHDPAAFDRHYQQTHVALAQKIPGLKGFVGNKPANLNPQEPSPYNHPKVRRRLAICRILRRAVLLWS